MINAPVREGEVFEGKYLVEKVLGAGAMGVVVAAKHVTLDQRVAIKFLLPNVAGHPETTARFVREARILAKIESPHVARVMDVGTSAAGLPYIVMEHLEGQDLSRLLHERGPIPPGEVASYVRQACDAVADAHAAGVVHRDLKPANLFLARTTTSRGRTRSMIKVLDFGISKSVDVDGLALTTTASLLGSPLYMAPEQLRATRDVDGRADVWSLGAILFELMTGRPPFLGDTMAALVAAVIYEPFPLDAMPPEVDAGLRAVVSRAMAKDREERFATVDDLAAALAPFADVDPASQERTTHPPPKIPSVSSMASTAPLAFGPSPPLGTSPPVVARVPSASSAPPAALSDPPTPINATPAAPPMLTAATTGRDVAWGATRSGQAKGGGRGQWIALGTLGVALGFVLYVNREDPPSSPSVAPASAAAPPPASASVVSASVVSAPAVIVPAPEVAADAGSGALRPRPAAIPAALPERTGDAGATVRPPPVASATSVVPSSIPRLPEFQPQ